MIIIKNLKNGLVNGMSGKVRKLEEDKITVHIDDDPYLYHQHQDKIVTLEREIFVERDLNDHITAIRWQFPLKLGYALTVDKSQGRSLKHVVVDAYNFWKPGRYNLFVIWTEIKNRGDI